MINIEDHLNLDADFSTEAVSQNNMLCGSSVLITFPQEPSDNISKEEIGKWVDHLMEMPDSDEIQSDLHHESTNEWEDPFAIIADRILSEDGV